MNPKMVFHPGIAYGIAIATAIVVGCMAARNQQSGWRKERTNGVMDILMAWAHAQAETRQMNEKPQTPPVAAPQPAAELGGQLAALTMALNVHSGVAPAPQPIAAEAEQHIAERETVERETAERETARKG